MTDTELLIKVVKTHREFNDRLDKADDVMPGIAEALIDLCEPTLNVLDELVAEILVNDAALDYFYDKLNDTEMDASIITEEALDRAG